MLRGTPPALELSDPAAGRRDSRRLRAELRRGLVRGEFAIVYQPRLDLATGAVRCCEALLRWPGRPGGALPPSAFMSVAERSDVCNDLGAWMLAQACAEARYWPGCRVSVNVSGRQLSSGALLGQVEAALAQAGLAPSMLELEFSEAARLESGTESLLTLSALRDLGVGIALDDFGVGSASLSMLRRLPLTTLKLDHCLIRELPASGEDAGIVRALVQAGHAMGLSVVAEAIETEAQRAFLQRIGCDEGQGYLFSRPLPPDLVWSFLANRDDTCSAVRSPPETPHERPMPH